MRWVERRLWGSREDIPSNDEVKLLGAQFYVTLGAHATALEQRLGKEPVPAALRKVREVMAVHERNLWTWQHAYQVEQLLVHLFDDETVSTELKRRLVELRTILDPDVVGWYERQGNEAQTAETRRVLLLRLVNDLQTARATSLLSGRVFVGMGAALIFCFFLRSGMLRARHFRASAFPQKISRCSSRRSPCSWSGPSLRGSPRNSFSACWSGRRRRPRQPTRKLHLLPPPVSGSVDRSAQGKPRDLGKPRRPRPNRGTGNDLVPCGAQAAVRDIYPC